jgi:hypothetical protein
MRGVKRLKIEIDSHETSKQFLKGVFGMIGLSMRDMSWDA